jgi:hypothetical protein
MEATIVLPPVFATLLARLESAEGRATHYFWMIIAVVAWWVCGATLWQYGRGWFAQRRGVPPEQPVSTSNRRQPRWLVIWIGAVACLFTLELVSHIGRPDKRTEELAFVFLFLFFQLLSNYPRSRADETQDLNLRATPGQQTPASPSRP